MLQSLTGLYCRFVPTMALLLFVLPFYNLLQGLIFPTEFVAALFLVVFVIGVICEALSSASDICKNNFRLYDLPLIIFISLQIVYHVSTSLSWVLLAKDGFWLVFSVYVYYHYANIKKSNEFKHVLMLLFVASIIIGFSIVIDNFNKLVLRNPAIFDAIIYRLKQNEDPSLDPYNLSYRATGLLGSRALTTVFIGLGGLAGLALFWRSRWVGSVLFLYSVLLLFSFALTAFIGFQLAVLVFVILVWSSDRFSGFPAYLTLVALGAFAIILFDLLLFPWIASNSVVTDPDGMPRSIVATFMALTDQQSNALLTPHEMGIIGSYSEQLRAYVSTTGLVQLLFGIGFGDDSGFVLGWDWGWIDWIAKIGILGAGTIIYMLVRSILSSGKLLHVGQSNLSLDDVDGVAVKQFVFLASVFLLLASVHYDILLTREMLPFFLYILALSRRLGTSAVISRKLAAQK